jgi:hypothetical protein
MILPSSMTGVRVVSARSQIGIRTSRPYHGFRALPEPAQFYHGKNTCFNGVFCGPHVYRIPRANRQMSRSRHRRSDRDMSGRPRQRPWLLCFGNYTSA